MPGSKRNSDSDGKGKFPRAFFDPRYRSTGVCLHEYVRYRGTSQQIRVSTGKRTWQGPLTHEGRTQNRG